MSDKEVNLFEQCLDRLAALENSGDVNLDAPIDEIVVPYLAGFGYGPQTAAIRNKLADAFAEKAPMTEIRERIKARIMWQAQPPK